MICLSVVVITLNEEKNLERCLLSVREISDEIIVVDSGSKDNTARIAADHNAKVIIQDFLGYSEQKNFATQKASNDWVLSLDADEALSAELLESIKKIKRDPDADAYSFNRLTNYCGKWVRHCGWYPDAKTRLYNRQKGKWNEEQIHESWELQAKDGRVKKLKGDLLHYTYYTLSDHVRQLEKFSEIIARRAVEHGKKGSLFKVFFAPKWKFFTAFIIRAGFLDGYTGYLVCKLSAFATFMKYSKIRQYAQFKKEGKEF